MDPKLFLPHRADMLLLDEIIEVQPGDSAIALSVFPAETHFYNSAENFPRVLFIEALAQTGAVALLSMADHKGKTAYFGGIKSAEFNAEIPFGGVFTFEMKLTKLRGNVGVGKGRMYHSGKQYAEAVLTFMID